MNPKSTPDRPSQPVVVLSPEVGPDRRIAFRIHAPQAETVRLNAGDIPRSGEAADLTRDERGVWETTVGPVAPGAYRYKLTVDGVPTIDPRNRATSESNGTVWSLVTVPGSEWMDTNDVPHGAVAEVVYHSTVLGRSRRMHVYTPSGYESGAETYPVFYLLHGATDSDDSWTSVGRAGFILDNLIAAGKARPMIVVMPDGHTHVMEPGGPRRADGEFDREFLADILPAVEARYRVHTDRERRAIAGLSMGGGQTLSLLLSHPERFAYAGVFSSGLFAAFPFRRAEDASAPPDPAVTAARWEDEHRAELTNEAKTGLKLFWFGTGRDDFLVQTSRSTVDLLKKHGFPVVYDETDGGHTWLVWRDYLIEFVPKLFR